MKISTSTTIRFQKLIGLFILCMAFAAPSPAHAQAIKMLPPTNCPNVPTGQPNVWGVLGWDSKNPLSCIPNFQFGENSYVGVGSATMQPLALLDLFGSGNYPYPTPGTGTVGTNLGNLHMQPIDNIDFNSTAITFGGNMTSSPSTGAYDGVAEAGIYVQYSRNTAYPEGGAGTKMYFGTTNNYAVGSQIHMTIDNLGNVGIGTTVPESTLDVNGGVRAGAATTGAACSPEGVMGYDYGKHAPVYCNNRSVWSLINVISGVATAMYDASATVDTIITTPVAYTFCAITVSGSDPCGRCAIAANSNGTFTLNQASCGGNTYTWCVMACW